MNLLLVLLTWAAAWAGTLQVDVLDIGQGDSILLRSPAGKTVLIDAGDGKADVPGMLRARKVEKIDLVIATHPHADHIGGMDEVLEQIPVKVYVDNGLPHTTATYSKVMALVESKGIAYKPGLAGVVFNLDDGIKIELLNPMQPKLKDTRSDLNANSVVARVTHGDDCLYLSGDSEEDTERLILQKGLKPCAVYKVAHHGSQYSSSDAFLRALKPTIALISAGQGNRYGHPTDQAMDRLRNVGATIYRTDNQGTIHLESSGKGVTVTTERDGGPATSAEAVAVAIPHTEAPAKHSVSDMVGEAVEAARININLASADQLQSLPGIGPSKAQAIVTFRAENGPFTSVDQLDLVPGIGPATLTGLRERVETGRIPDSSAETH